MGTIEVIESGMQSSVQDLGRPGYRASGVPVGGAFDTLALRVGNRLLGNDEAAAGIESTVVGGIYRIDQPAVICLSGARADGAEVECGGGRFAVGHLRPTAVPAGGVVRIGRLVDGARGYLCIKGGVRSDRVLGSRSALVSLPGAGLGRALRTGDRLSIGGDGRELADEAGPSWLPRLRSTGNDTRVLRVVAGAHNERFTESVRAQLGGLIFRVSAQSNRAGVRLADARLSGGLPGRVRSEGVLPGYVQVPGSGEPIVLGVDGPVTGGYPVIACVIEADLAVLGQCAPGDRVRFEWIARESAVRALREQEATIGAVQPIPTRAIGAETEDG